MSRVDASERKELDGSTGSLGTTSSHIKITRNDDGNGITFKVAPHKAEPVVIYPVPVRTDKFEGLLPEEHYLRSCIEYTDGGLGKILQQSDWDPKNSVASSNGFVYAVTNAYNRHHHLVLKPDDVWIAITTQFARYVVGNAEVLRKKFVSHEGQKEVTVSADATTMWAADYGALSQQMVSQLQRNINDPKLVDWILPKFTTTTHTDLIVGSIVFMSSMQKYFKMIFELLCGIPQVTLLGSPEDWKIIHERIPFLRQYGPVCEKWADMLSTVTESLYKSSQGDVDVDFWQRVCQSSYQGSGSEYLSGWITTFCVFDEVGRWRGDEVTEETENGYVQSDYPVINTNRIQAGYATVPVQICDNGKTYDSVMFAGHVAYKLIDKTTIAPNVAWSIVLRKDSTSV